MAGGEILLNAAWQMGAAKTSTQKPGPIAKAFTPVKKFLFYKMPCVVLAAPAMALLFAVVDVLKRKGGGRLRRAGDVAMRFALVVAATASGWAAAIGALGLRAAPGARPPELFIPLVAITAEALFHETHQAVKSAVGRVLELPGWGRAVPCSSVRFPCGSAVALAVVVGVRTAP
jgi:hypothetical protein